MKKKISIVLIILVIVGVVFVIKNMIIGDIGEKTFEIIKDKIITNFALMDLVIEFKNVLSMNIIKKIYDKYSSIAKIRETACTDIIGTNLKGMLQAGENLGFNTYAVKGTIENLNKKTPIPFIAHIHVPDEQGYFNEHFVVIANITKKYVYVWNPDATAKKKWIKKSEFEKTWSGYVIFLEPKQDFKPERDSGKLLLKFLPIL